MTSTCTKLTRATNDQANYTHTGRKTSRKSENYAHTDCTQVENVLQSVDKSGNCTHTDSTQVKTVMLVLEYIQF